ncbi:tRNA (adenosine(37)-N6)-threonylcarbamoyltransferase complex dimerization subunit type 1 TsaB [Paramaledivibacter caminithermalis]|jgi:tRNA threonylcarbamoyladenosine biosynthesis protein TsaB|uniref:tRNA threonylcarbamoyladenosine biosynthesis protein TsaB n=1 Tax=Paramaledivibacter caminithermalis (strain DSM 15212 / CIP 107654 / DViRD3) TaxID=1121301 RepID=A0A1M6L8C9_PARC5|nr:tRNA (adenosine(37)-N6)-threonylcarbamoyltransferase complex dimerization subunit type 1 TsaB [Paramaledivibacter caminithermalis]SHJ67452.1 tRNA threonylcarbamoyladenosine biosynthesis protein TsaB [Paramaledivibacter caminithermalis DSM 15212]
MNILAIDTSSIVATVAVMDRKKLLGEYTINSPMTHSQKLMPIIDELLSTLELSMEDIELIAVSRGPGSFTGIRIGIATVKGLAHGWNIPVIGVSSLEGLAYNITYSKELICPIMDARRNQVYTGVYKWVKHKLVDIIKEAPSSIDKLIDELKQRQEKVIFLGDGLGRYKDDIISSLGEKAVFAPQYVNMQRASSIAQLALDKINGGQSKPENYLNITPVYLRKSEAERQYEEKMKRCSEINE